MDAALAPAAPAGRARTAIGTAYPGARGGGRLLAARVGRAEPLVSGRGGVPAAAEEGRGAVSGMGPRADEAMCESIMPAHGGEPGAEMCLGLHSSWGEACAASGTGRVVVGADVDPRARKEAQRAHPGMEVFADCRDITKEVLERYLVQIVQASFPCAPWRRAGARRGGTGATGATGVTGLTGATGASGIA